MKKKYIIIFALLFTTLSLSTMLNVKAQGLNMGVVEDDEFIWEVTYLDLNVFIKVLGYEPNFEVGDRIKFVVQEVGDREIFWIVYGYFWDYQVDWSQQGSYESIQIFKNPTLYNESVFLPIPIEDYLLAVEADNPTDYFVDGKTITTITKLKREFIYEKTYNGNGVLVSEILKEYDEFGPDKLILKVEEAFMIVPMGIYFIGFSVIGIIAITIITLKKKRIVIRK